MWLARPRPAPYTRTMTAKEQLEHLVAELDEEDASYALEVLQRLIPRQAEENEPRRRLPSHIGIGDSGRTDISERVDEILAEGFGR
jgi:hypothetical protein